MGALLKVIPTILSVVRAAGKLRGATESKTTQANWQGGGVVMFVLCVVVVCLGLIPGSPLASTELQVAAIAILAPILSPLLARMIRLRDDPEVVDDPPPAPFDEDTVNTPICRVKRDGETSWTAYDGNALDAWAEGWQLGVARDGGDVWDLVKGEKTGGSVRLPKPAADEEQRKRGVAKLKEAFAKVREEKGND